MKSKLAKGLLCVGAAVVLWLLPVPAGLKPIAWQLFALFVGTILGFVLNPLPSSAVILVSLVAGISLGLFKLNDALASYGNSTIWLVFAAFLFAKGFIKTGLGRRIALFLRRLSRCPFFISSCRRFVPRALKKVD